MKKHLAIFSKNYIAKILNHEKTVESRFSKVRCAPYQHVEVGDIILLKEQSGPIRGQARVKDVVYFSGLTPEKIKAIEEEYNNRLKVDEKFWQTKRDAKYATLMSLEEVKQLPPETYEKKDRRGWVVLPSDDADKQLFLFEGFNETHDKTKNESIPLASDCANGLHSFLHSPLKNNKGHHCCRNCGADVIDWQRVHQRDIRDSEFIIQELRKEKWRNDWWNKEIDLGAINHALRKGEIDLRRFAVNRIRKSVGDEKPYRDGYQTPYQGNIVYYAQHALACCCRKCIEYWHGIPRGRKLTQHEINYLTDLVMAYAKTKIPNLTKNAIYVPPIRKKRR